jgi:hypothetical protein
MLFPAEKFLLVVVTPPVAARMVRLAVAALSGALSVFFLQATPAPETSWGLLTVVPDVAETLAAVILSQTSLAL